MHAQSAEFSQDPSFEPKDKFDLSNLQSIIELFERISPVMTLQSLQVVLGLGGVSIHFVQSDEAAVTQTFRLEKRDKRTIGLVTISFVNEAAITQ